MGAQAAPPHRFRADSTSLSASRRGAFISLFLCFSPAVDDGHVFHDEALEGLVAAGVAAVHEHALVGVGRGFVGVFHFSVDRETLPGGVEGVEKTGNRGEGGEKRWAGRR